MRVLDYNRTVVGYHGTRRSVAPDIVRRKRSFTDSRNPDDWLGHGVYFWEYAPRQALWWARRRQRRQNWGELIAVLGSMIRLGNGFDLLDPLNVEDLKSVYDLYLTDAAAAGRVVPNNANHHKYLDGQVFQFAYRLIERESGAAVDTCRAVYARTGRDRAGRNPRVWPKSWILREAHIQLCVRNRGCILGTWIETIEGDGPPAEDDHGEGEIAADQDELLLP